MLKKTKWILLTAACGLTALALVACSGDPSAPEESAAKEAATLPYPEAVPSQPGQIAPECEGLLQKSQDWGYVPGQKWKPSSEGQALEALRFFGDFHFVPETSSDFFRAVLAAPMPASETEAQAIVARLNKVQVCDTLLASTFLDALIAHHWKPENAPEARTKLFQFVLNQQALVMPYLPRMVALEVYRKALVKGLVRGQASSVKAVQAKGEASRKKIDSSLTGSALKTLSEIRDELSLSEQLRESMSRTLPLP